MINCYFNSTNSQVHSPIIGYLGDSYPIYGPFGYANANSSTSGIKRMASSYKLRSITSRTSTPSNPSLTSSQYGPAFDSTYPLGSFLEDYDYNAANGDLDAYNGRWCVTPEYPQGTYAYFVATDSSGGPAYPYVAIGSYFGKVASTSKTNTASSSATTYF